MKKIISIFVVFLFCCEVSCAEVLKAKTLCAIYTEHPPKTVELKALSDMQLNNLHIKKDYIIYGNFIDPIPPRAWGKNASFSVRITSYKDLEGAEHSVSDNYVIKYRQRLKPNWHRQSFSLMGANDSGVTFSPYDIDLIKESTSVGDFLAKEMTKNSMWEKGWELEYKPNQVIYFNY